jgi:NADPH:quinone reductase-like Zn-dependent oxidoreductase
MSETPIEKPSDNMTAYLASAKARPLQVASAPYSSPKLGHTTIHNHAVAVNPIDRMK